MRCLRTLLAKLYRGHIEKWRGESEGSQVFTYKVKNFKYEYFSRWYVLYVDQW